MRVGGDGSALVPHLAIDRVGSVLVTSWIHTVLFLLRRSSWQSLWWVTMAHESNIPLQRGRAPLLFVTGINIRIKPDVSAVGLNHASRLSLFKWALETETFEIMAQTLP